MAKKRSPFHRALEQYTTDNMEAYDRSASVLSKVLAHARRGGKHRRLHPGPIRVYRGVFPDNPTSGWTDDTYTRKGVSSWTRKRSIAQQFGSRILTETLHPSIPAIDVDRALGARGRARAYGHDPDRGSEGEVLIAASAFAAHQKAWATRKRKYGPSGAKKRGTLTRKKKR